jgi:WD40 repeat protein
MKLKTICSLLFFAGVPLLLLGQSPRLVVPIGHTAAITSLCFSTDGKYVLTGSEDNTAKLWNLDGEEIITYEGHAKEVNSVAFSRDGQFIVTGSSDFSVKLWNVSGSEVKTFQGHQGPVNSVAISPEGDQVLSGGSDNTVLLWDIERGKKVRQFNKHDASIRFVAFSADGEFILTGSKNSKERPNPNASRQDEVPKEIKEGAGIGKLWERSSGKEVQCFVGHEDNVTSAAFSSDGKFVLTGSWDKTVRIWEVATGIERKLISDNLAFINAVAISKDGRFVFGGSGDGSCFKWDRLSGEPLDTFKIDNEKINALAISPNGKFLLTGNEAGLAYLWDLETGKLKTVFARHASSITRMAISTGDTSTTDEPQMRVAMGDAAGVIRMWDVVTGDVHAIQAHSGPVADLRFNLDGSSCLSGGMDGAIFRWNMNGEAVDSVFTDVEFPSCLALSPAHPGEVNGGSQILYGTFRNTIDEFSLEKRIQLRTLLHGDQATPERAGDGIEFSSVKSISALSFSPDGSTFFSGSWDETAVLWDAETGKKIHTLKDVASGVSALAYSPGGEKLVVGSWDKSATMWDAKTRKLIRTFSGHVEAVTALAFSEDGTMLATGGEDQVAILWDTSSENSRQIFTGHTNTIICMQFLPGGNVLATGSADNTIKFWSTETGEELATLICLGKDDWAATTPSGLFDATPGAMEIMHYVVGQEVVALEQMKDRYYEPGFLPRVLLGGSASLRDVSELSSVDLYPEMEVDFSDAQFIEIHLKERDGGMGPLSLFINGKEVNPDINPARDTVLRLRIVDFVSFYNQNENIIAFQVTNAGGWLKSPIEELVFAPFQKGDPHQLPSEFAGDPNRVVEPHLFVLAVGTSNYVNPEMDLTFPDHDARSFCEAMRITGNGLFENKTHYYLLTSDTSDARAVSTKSNIEAAFDSIAAIAGPDDVVVIYFSGHGSTFGPPEKSQFYYLTKDIPGMELDEEEVRDQFAISSDDYTNWITRIRAHKQVLIFDACNSGKITDAFDGVGSRGMNPSKVRALDKLKDRTGMYILTGSAEDKVSFEAGQFGQGLLTYSLLQGMSGLALTPERTVEVMNLFQYSLDRVPELAETIKRRQKPVLSVPRNAESFPIGWLKQGAVIPLPMPKPVFIRNSFQDEEQFEDVLGLVDSLEVQLRIITAKAAQAPIIYVDAKEYPGGYSIKGRYNTTEAGIISCRGHVFKDKKSIGEFQVEGETTAIPDLVNSILDEVILIVEDQ